VSLARRILVPIDFSPASRAALDQALSLAQAFDATVEVLHVLWNPPPYVGFEALSAQLPYGVNESFLGWVQRSAGAQMESFLASVDEPWRSRVKRRFLQGDAAEMIVSAAEHDAIDLIVMGTHGRRGVAHLLLGSVAEKVVRLAPCPVMTICTPG
jgi:universal stress protein A